MTPHERLRRQAERLRVETHADDPHRGLAAGMGYRNAAPLLLRLLDERVAELAQHNERVGYRAECVRCQDDAAQTASLADELEAAMGPETRPEEPQA